MSLPKEVPEQLPRRFSGGILSKIVTEGKTIITDRDPRNMKEFFEQKGKTMALPIKGVLVAAVRLAHSLNDPNVHSGHMLDVLLRRVPAFRDTVEGLNQDPDELAAGLEREITQKRENGESGWEITHPNRELDQEADLGKDELERGITLGPDVAKALAVAQQESDNQPQIEGVTEEEKTRNGLRNLVYGLSFSGASVGVSLVLYYLYSKRVSIDDIISALSKKEGKSELEEPSP